MPPAVAAAGITAAGTLAGVGVQALSARGQQRAAYANQREQMAREDRYRDMAIQDYRQRMDAFNRTRNAVLAHYGINVDDGSGGAAAAAGPTVGQILGGGGGGGSGAAAPIAPVAGAQGIAAEDEQQPSNGEDWNDWRKLGLG